MEAAGGGLKPTALNGGGADHLISASAAKVSRQHHTWWFGSSRPAGLELAGPAAAGAGAAGGDGAGSGSEGAGGGGGIVAWVLWAAAVAAVRRCRLTLSNPS